MCILYNINRTQNNHPIKKMIVVLQNIFFFDNLGTEERFATLGENKFLIDLNMFCIM